jgi:hypothetical protein
MQWFLAAGHVQEERNDDCRYFGVLAGWSAVSGARRIFFLTTCNGTTKRTRCWVGENTGKVPNPRKSVRWNCQHSCCAFRYGSVCQALRSRCLLFTNFTLFQSLRHFSLVTQGNGPYVEGLQICSLSNFDFAGT